MSDPYVEMKSWRVLVTLTGDAGEVVELQATTDEMAVRRWVQDMGHDGVWTPQHPVFFPPHRILDIWYEATKK